MNELCISRCHMSGWIAAAEVMQYYEIKNGGIIAAGEISQLPIDYPGS